MRIPDGIRGSIFPYGMMLPGNEYGWYIGQGGDEGYGYTMVLERLYAYPMFIPNSIKIDRLIIDNLFAGQGVGRAAHVGIYESKNDGTHFPGRLVCDVEIACSAAGKLYTNLPSPVRLYPGVYWIVIIANNVNLEPYESYMGPHFFGSHGVEQYGSGGYSEFINGVYSDGVTYGALPSDFPTITGWMSNSSGGSGSWGWMISFRVVPDPDRIYIGANLPLSLLPAANYEVRTGESGWMGGGESPYTAEIDGMDFPTETGIDTAATLAVTRSYAAGIHSSSRGYFCGGYYSTSYYSEIDGIQFSDETAINPGAVLSVGRAGLVGVNSSTHGYCMGGHGSGSPSVKTDIDGMRFSDETAVNPSAALDANRDDGASYGSSTRGYFHGGRDTSFVQQDDIYYFQYSDETDGTLAALCVVARSYLDGVNSSTRGYAGGGHTGSAYSWEIDGLQFSDETQINPAATLPDTPTVGIAGLTSNGNQRGYWCGGYYGSSPFYYDSIQGIKFSDETAINPSAGIKHARDYLAGVYQGGAL